MTEYPQREDLIGRWVKRTADECALAYPDTLEFEAATYRGQRGPTQGFVVWDAGIWRVDALGRVRISTASDEVVDYDYAIDDGTLTFRDDAGCQFSYQRSS